MGKHYTLGHGDRIEVRLASHADCR
jgi:hypothetical protein